MTAAISAIEGAPRRDVPDRHVRADSETTPCTTDTRRTERRWCSSLARSSRRGRRQSSRARHDILRHPRVRTPARKGRLSVLDPEFFGGVSEITVPDNLRSGVTKASKYEPELNRTYADLARHYGTAIIPARAYKPRDKAKVDGRPSTPAPCGTATCATAPRSWGMGRRRTCASTP